MLVLKGQLVDICRPVVMGIVNVTPDSFALRCPTMDEQGVLSECERLLQAGADWLDVGACSTRPGAEPISEQQEVARLDMALKAIRRVYPQVVVSVDTFRAQVAKHVVDTYGVDIINDVSGIQDADMLQVLSRRRVPYILAYPGAPGAAMLSFFAAQLNRLHQAGISDVMIDPDLGFGKTLEENYRCLGQLEILQTLHCPILVGLSRKSMIYELLGCSPQEALHGTTAAHMLALMHGANILRVHDAAEARQAIRIWEMGKNSQ